MHKDLKIWNPIGLWSCWSWNWTLVSRQRHWRLSWKRLGRCYRSEFTCWTWGWGFRWIIEELFIWVPFCAHIRAFQRDDIRICITLWSFMYICGCILCIMAYNYVPKACTKKERCTCMLHVILLNELFSEYDHTGFTHFRRFSLYFHKHVFSPIEHLQDKQRLSKEQEEQREMAKKEAEIET